MSSVPGAPLHKTASKFTLEIDNDLNELIEPEFDITSMVSSLQKSKRNLGLPSDELDSDFGRDLDLATDSGNTQKTTVIAPPVAVTLFLSTARFLRVYKVQVIIWLHFRGSCGSEYH